MDQQAESVFTERMLGESSLRAMSYEQFLEAATLKVQRDALRAMLQEFDTFCHANDIGYFLFGESLQGIIAYEDFPSGHGAIQLGMLQKDYDRFVECNKEAIAQGAWTFSWQLLRYLEEHPAALRRYPCLQTNDPMEVCFKGQQLFTDESLPLVIKPFIEISVFNAVPDDFYLRKKFYRQMRRRNNLYELVLNMHQFMRGRRPAIALYPLFGMLALLVPLRLAVKLIWHKARKYEGQGMLCAVRLFGERTKTVELADLVPYQRLTLHDIEVNCPANTDIWAPAPLDEPDEELRRLQAAALKIVAEIDRVCGQLDIGYFVCGGTLLGHVRHGGFIPWDDDIDVGMPRKDYERFMKEAPTVLDTKTFFLQTRESDPNIPYLFSKLRLNGSSYVTAYNQFRDFNKGICVDIFPFDAIPDSEEELEDFRAQVYKQVKAHNHVANRQYPAVTAEQAPHKNLDWLIAQATGHLLARHYWKKSLAETQQAFNEVVQAYNTQADELGLSYIASFIPTWTMIRNQDLFPYQRIVFEGVTVNIPANPDVFLNMQYGDYMALPPRHVRRGHELLEWGVEQEQRWDVDADDLDDGEVNRPPALHPLPQRRLDEPH